MMSTLTDRYVSEVLRGVPAPMREDVEQELRASIADAIDASGGHAEDPQVRVPSGDQASSAESDEERVLNELGDPARLAASLTDGPQYLIGPGLYWDYRRLLRTLLTIVPPIVAVVVSTVQVFAGTPPLEVLIDGIWLFLVVAFQVVLWTTLGFAIAERTGAREVPGQRQWSVADLPERVDRGVTLGETVGTVLGLLVGIAALIWQRYGAGVAGSGEAVPLLDPDLWSFWLPALIVLMSAQVVLQLLAHARGRWTVALAAFRVVGDLIFGVASVYLLLTQQVLNDAFFAELDLASWAEPGSPLTQGIAWVIGVGAVVDVFETIRKVRA
jgi:hypothetical protein